MRKIESKRIVILLVAILTAAFVGIFAFVGISNLIADARETAYRDETAPILLEMSELEKRRYEMINEYMGSAPCGANTSIIFLDMNVRVYEQVYPLFEEREHLTAILAISPEQMPGDEGKITKEQLHELISHGWTVAIFWEGIDTDDGIDTAALADYLTEMGAALAELDLPMADTLIFDKFTYSDEYDTVLAQHGVRFATHYGDGAYQLIDKETKGEVMHPGVVGWNANGYGNAFLIKVEKEKGISSFAVEFESGGDLGSFLDLDRKDYMDAFERMLDAIEENADRGDVSCIGFKQAYINRAAYVDAWTVMMDVIGDDLAAIAARVVELEQAILQIMEKYE